jgi:hypothetical protein
MSNVIRQLGLCFINSVLFVPLREQRAVRASARQPRSVVVLRMFAPALARSERAKQKRRRECVLRAQCWCSTLRRGVRGRRFGLQPSVLHNRVGGQTARRKCVRRRA